MKVNLDLAWIKLAKPLKPEKRRRRMKQVSCIKCGNPVTVPAGADNNALCSECWQKWWKKFEREAENGKTGISKR